jgi:DNA-binding MarR family transcriptional regulator
MTIEEEIKQKKFRSSHHRMLVNLLFTSNWASAHQNKLLKPFGLSLQQFNILRILRGQYPNPTTLGLIQERMLDKNSNASRLVDKLKLKKLVERDECKQDRRQVAIVMTEKGLELLKELDALIDGNEKMFMTISEEEADELSRILDKLRG